MNKMHEVVGLAKKLASEREGDQHPVANLALRAFDQGINEHDFDEALKAAVSEGWLTLTPDCGPKRLGVFKFSGR